MSLNAHLRKLVHGACLLSQGPHTELRITPSTAFTLCLCYFVHASFFAAGTGDLTSQVLATHFATEYFPAENDGLGEDDEEEEGELGSQIPAAWAVAADIDWGRCARFTLLGAGFLAPCLHFWYGFLGRAIPGKALSNVVKRVALDQLVFAPVFLMSFLSLVMLLDGQAAKVCCAGGALHTVFEVQTYGSRAP